MMDFGVFKELLKGKLPEYLPEEMKGIGLRLGRGRRINMAYDNLTVVPTDRCPVSPVFNLDQKYEEYQAGAELEELLREMAGTVFRAYEAPARPPEIASKETLKENVVMNLVNTGQNREYLRDVPHREFQDLSVIFRWIIGKDKEGMDSIVVTDDIAERFGMTADELFQAAVRNTREYFPPKVTDVSEMLLRLAYPEELTPEKAEMFGFLLEGIPAKEKMWLISNNERRNGASSMLYENILHELAEKIGTDLYILPSSVHEVMAISVDMGEPEELSEWVQEINMSELGLEDRLSNNVYFYDKNLRTISMATDTPNRRLDGIVAEQACSRDMAGRRQK